MSFHEPQRRVRKIYLKGNILGSDVKDPYATGVRYSDVSCPGFYKCAAVVAAEVRELQISTERHSGQKDTVGSQQIIAVQCFPLLRRMMFQMIKWLPLDSGELISLLFCLIFRQIICAAVWRNS